jgi:hypothetical protein
MGAEETYNILAWKFKLKDLCINEKEQSKKVFL